MLKKVGIAILALVAVLVVVIVTRPATYTVTRSLRMNAPPNIVYGHVIDFREWDEWSPWEKMDPGMKKEYAGPQSGVGAKYTWVGNPDNVGTGSMTIADVKPNEAVGITLEFKVPFESKSRTEFAFEPSSGGTNVSWTMKGDNDFMGKAFSLVMSMDKMIGADFEKGLATLKAHAEEHAKKAAEQAAKPPPQTEAAIDGGTM